jgi:hypothetical protein
MEDTGGGMTQVREDTEGELIREVGGRDKKV